MTSVNCEQGGADAATGPNHEGRRPARKVLLACGPLSALVYIVWHELAALQWEGYSRISNAISELSLTGSPSKWILEPWEGLSITHCS
jgi:hypothetical protein